MPHERSDWKSPAGAASKRPARIPDARSCPRSSPPLCCRLLRPVWLHPWCRSVTIPRPVPPGGDTAGGPKRCSTRVGAGKALGAPGCCAWEAALASR